MRIQYCSDLHLEFEENNKYLTRNPLIISGEILILAGDITQMQFEFFDDPFFSFISDNYKQVFWVPGNHEFYHSDISNHKKSYHLKLRNNINIVHNVQLEYENIRFIFSTLWSDISSENEKTIEQNVPDFAHISNKNGKFKVSDFNNLHAESLNFVQQSLNGKKQNTVVVSHHLPSFLCNLPNNNNSKTNHAYCVDLSSYIENCGANFWIYGHSHYNQKPLFIGKTILLTNQLGCVHINEHQSFRHNAYFSV